MSRIWKENMKSHSINTYTVALNAQQYNNNNEIDLYQLIDINLDDSFENITINSLWNHFKKSKKEK